MEAKRSATGDAIAGLLNRWPWMDDWMDPERVWAFQRRFGVRRVRVLHPSPGAPFESVDADEHARKATTKGHCRTRSDASLSSGYSSADAATAGDHERNLVLYRVGSWLWHYFFLMGTQLGDETYYAIFFCFWFWNIDGAVGRRLVLVWNLVMYIGILMSHGWPCDACRPHE